MKNVSPAVRSFNGPTTAQPVPSGSLYVNRGKIRPIYRPLDPTGVERNWNKWSVGGNTSQNFYVDPKRAAASKLLLDFGVTYQKVPEIVPFLLLVLEELKKVGSNSTSAVPQGRPTEKYANRPNGEDAPAFIERVWGPWLDGNFSRADLRKEDEGAATGLVNWETKHRRRADINLPTLQEKNDAVLLRSLIEKRMGKPFGKLGGTRHMRRKLK